MPAAKANVPQAVQLQFPVGGLSRVTSYQSQPPFTTYDACNVRPVDSLDRRTRGGSRPGVNKEYYELLGSGNPIRMLGSVTYTAGGGALYDQELFEGSSLGSKWGTMSWVAGGFPTLSANSYGSATAAGSEQGAVRTAFSPTISTSSDYYIRMFIVPFEAAHHGEYAIWFRMNDATPAGTTAGAVARLTLTDTGTYSGSLKVYVAGVPTTYAFSTGTDTVAQAGWFTVKVSGNTVTCYWRGTTLVTQAISAAAGQRIGFSTLATVAGGRTLIDTFRIEYYTSGNPQPYTNVLLAVSNGILYRSTIGGQMVAVANTNSCNFATDRQIHMVDYQQKAYIADCGDPKASGTDGVQGTGTTKFDSATFADWTTLGIDTNNDCLEIYEVTGAMIAGIYRITTVASGELTTSPACNAGAGTGKFRIMRAPKIYDPSTDTITIWTATTNYGGVPLGCPLIALYLDTIMLGGAPHAPHLWNMSAQGDPLNWLYSALKSTGAVAGNNSTAGQVGEPLTALIPFEDKYIVMGCRNSTWVLDGHPRFGGQIRSINRLVGPVSKSAWCKGPNSELIVLTLDGLYSGNASGIKSVSREKMPRELLNIDPTAYTVMMAYDPVDRGIHIYQTSELGALQRHWWVDWVSKGFWPKTLSTSHEPTACYYYANTIAEDSGVLLGCRDGYIRKFRNEYEADDSTEIVSYVNIGPIMLAPTGQDGLITELKCATAKGSGEVDWAVATAVTGNDVVTATAALTGTFALEGMNYAARPRLRGPAAMIKLSNGEVNRRWGIDWLQIKRIMRSELVI